MKLFEVFDGICGSGTFIRVFITQTLKRVFRAQNCNSHTIFSELSPTQMHSRSRLSKGQGKLVLFSAISPKIGCEADYKEARSFIIALKFLYHFPALTGVSSLITVGYLTSPCIFVLHHSWKNRLILLRSRQSSMLDTRRIKWSYKENDIHRPNPPTKNSASLTF